MTIHDQRTSGARERPPSGLPVTERRLHLVGDSTTGPDARVDRYGVAIEGCVRNGWPQHGADDASARSGWSQHVIDDAGDDPKLERPDAFLDASSGVLDSRAAAGQTARPP